MISTFVTELLSNSETRQLFERSFTIREVAAKTTLLREGEVADTMYLVRSGCLRLWFNDDGRDVTFQFFFEDQPVSSLESFLGREPSLFSLESLEPTRVAAIGREEWDVLFAQLPEMRERFMSFLVQRLGNYSRLFLSRIKDSPQQRYEALLREHPEIVQRVPQHYIASYLGITPVSLSRIRRRRVSRGKGAS
ncbi:MAG: Crp/Fnr family transcriptional regulator [Myxococcales bacterium]